MGAIRELRDRPHDVIEQGNVKITCDEIHAVCKQFVGDSAPRLCNCEAEFDIGPSTSTDGRFDRSRLHDAEAAADRAVDHG